MPRKATKTSANLQRKVTLKIDFYRCAAREDHVRFEEALEKVRLLPQNSRTQTVGKERIILCDLIESNGLYEGEMARLRMTETPALGNLQGEVSDLSLRSDEGLAERTAFLFHSESQVLAIHSVREAVSAGKLSGYCDNIQASPDGFVFEPVLRNDTLSSFNHLQAIRKVEIKIARVGAASKAPANARTSVKNYLKLRELAQLDVETMTITLGMGYERKRNMAMDATRSLVRSFLDNKDALAVETLTISGKENGDEAVVLDLLHGRIQEVVEISVRERTASYNQRRDAVKSAFETNRSLLVPSIGS